MSKKCPNCNSKDISSNNANSLTESFMCFNCGMVWKADGSYRNKPGHDPENFFK